MFWKSRTTNTFEKRGHPFVQQTFLKLCTKFQSKRASRSGTGARGTWQPTIFTYFASSSTLKSSWHSSFNLVRSTCSFYWCYIFPLNIRVLKLSIQKGKQCYSIAIVEHNKKKILENYKNVQNHHWRCSIKKAVVKNFAVFKGKNLSWSLFLIKSFQHRRFPVNIVKFLRTPILKNICERLLLIFSSNEEQHLLV